MECKLRQTFQVVEQIFVNITSQQYRIRQRLQFLKRTKPLGHRLREMQRPNVEFTQVLQVAQQGEIHRAVVVGQNVEFERFQSTELGQGTDVLVADLWTFEIN